MPDGSLRTRFGVAEPSGLAEFYAVVINDPRGVQVVFPHRTPVNLAERLGGQPLDFPRGHIGFVGEPNESAVVFQHALA